MIVHGLGAAEFSVKRQGGSGGDAGCEFFVFKLHAPNAGAGGATVLLQNSFPVGQGGGEGLVEGFHVVVGGGVGGHKVGVFEFDQSILGAIGHHLGWGGHAHQAGFAEFGEQIKVALFPTGNVAGVHAGNISIEIRRKIFE